MNQFFAALQQLFTLGTALAPSLNAWVEAHIDAERQHVMKRRMAQCFRICKREKFRGDLVVDEVSILFKDLSAQQQSEVVDLINAELPLIPVAKK